MRIVFRPVTRLILALSCAWPFTVAALDGEAIFRENADAVVVVTGATAASGQAVQGSGCVLSRDGWVLVTAHQVADVEDLRVQLRDGRSLAVKEKRVDREREFALLRVPLDLANTVSLGDSDALREGADLVAIAAPMNLPYTMTRGWVAARNRTYLGRPVVQAELSAAPGSSGGPVFDRNGLLVGLVVARLQDDARAVLVNPINEARPLLEGVNLHTSGETRPMPEAPESEMIIPAYDVSSTELAGIRAFNKGVASDNPARKAAAYSEAVAALPGFFEAWFNLGVAYTALGDYPAAAEAYFQARNTRPASVRLHRNLGRVLLRLNREAEAVAVFEKGRDLAPEDPVSHNDAGEALRRAGRLGEAESAFQEALRMRPDYAAAHYNLGLTHAEAGRGDSAIRHFERYLELAPEAGDRDEVRQWIARLRTGQP